MRTLTLALVKPHLASIKMRVCQLEELVHHDGFRVEARTEIYPDLSLARQLYQQHAQRFFYHRLLTSFCSGPVIAYILSRENAIERWRELLGPTQVYRAIYSHPNCVRAKFGLTDTRNAAHGSDSPESVAREIKIFFPNFPLEDWGYFKEN